MLVSLSIENMAVFARADIAFGDGLNVLTGETGAGKSIVIDALGLALGARAQKELVRRGADKAAVRALFVGLPPSIDSWMAENGMDGCPDGELLLVRELFADGRTTCRVNGRVQTVALLKALGQLVLNVHGQHDTYQLLRSETHLHCIDRFADNDSQQADYSAAYAAWNALRRERDSLQLSADEKQQRIDMLRYRLDDLARLNLREGEEEALLARRKLLRGAGKLSAAATLCRSLLKGDDDSEGACQQLAQAAKTMSAVANMGDEWAAAAERLHALHADLTDAAEQTMDLFDGNEFSEQELEAVETRLDELNRAETRHGAPVDELLTRRDTLQAELDSLGFADMRLAEIERAIKPAELALSLAAQALSRSRQAAAVALKQRIEADLKDLDMGSVTFTAALTDTPDYLPTGTQTACFLLSTNPGEPEKQLSKIASGGELARIMLALQNVLSGTDDVSTLVFDEVDAGVSGRAAQRVAEKLAAVGRRKQVLCVTHLPQVAAYADTHLRIEKAIIDGRADTQVSTLDAQGRIDEVGRLLGADAAGQTALDNAAVLIQQAESSKQN